MKIKKNLKMLTVFVLLVLSGCDPFGKNEKDPVSPVVNQPPTVTLAADKISGNTPLAVNFTASALDADGSIASYDWDFEGNGNYLVTTTTNIANHTYNTSGTYNAKVKVTDDDGAVALTSVVITAATITPSNQPPKVTLSADTTSGNAPLTVNFTASGSDPDGSIAGYSWDFEGNGNYSTTAITHITSYTYNTSGTYNVKVKATDNVGAADTASVVITVIMPPPVSGISFTVSGTPVNNSVYLEKASTNGNEITLDIRVKGGTDVYGAALEINYDSAKISYVSSLIGNYLGNQDNVIFTVGLLNYMDGVLLIGIAKKGNVPGVNGDGSLCTVVFKALTAQTDTPVQFNGPYSTLKFPTGNIPGTVWLGGTLTYY